MFNNFQSTGLLYPWLGYHSYFILYKAIVNGTVYLISLSVTSLMTYKNETDFWILILYPEIAKVIQLF